MNVIAGVTGHVGSVTAKELLAKGQKVRVIVRDAQKGAAWSKLGAELAVGSLNDEAFLTGALRGATGFFTLLPPNFAATDLYAAQRKTADAIAAAVKASKVPHVVMLSSLGADQPRGTGPIKGLHYLENALRATGTRLTAIRATGFQENVGDSLGAARSAGIFPNFTPSADLAIPLVASRDIGVLAASTLAAPPAKGEVVDIIGPAYSTRQLAAKLGEALHKTIQVVEVPPAAQADTMIKAGVPKPMADALAEMYAGAAKGLLQPKGDRLVQSKTPIDEVLKQLTA